MEPRLLKRPKIVIRNFYCISHAQMVKLLRARKLKKYGFLEVAYEVEELGKDKWNVRIEYIAKDY